MSLSENDPEPDRRSGPPAWLIAAIVAIVVAIVALHLSGVVGNG
jgi:hypothetical protein